MNHVDVEATVPEVIHEVCKEIALIKNIGVYTLYGEMITAAANDYARRCEKIGKMLFDSSYFIDAEKDGDESEKRA